MIQVFNIEVASTGARKGFCENDLVGDNMNGLACTWVHKSEKISDVSGVKQGISSRVHPGVPGYSPTHSYVERIQTSFAAVIESAVDLVQSEILDLCSRTAGERHLPNTTMTKSVRMTGSIGFK